MHPADFDRFARRLAASGISRRSLLRALGLGGASLAGSSRLVAAQPGMRSTGSHVRWQDIGAGLIADQAFLLDYDVDAIFRFVADEIAFDSYDGFLRSPEATLRGRAGNALDKAMLLKALLAESEIDAVVRTGALDEADASTLAASAQWDRSAIDQRDVLAAVAALSIDQRAALSEASATPTADDEAARAQLDAASVALVDAARESASDLGQFLQPVAASAGFATQPAAAALSDSQRSNHGWVEYKFGADLVRLDPSLPGTAPETVAAESATPEADQTGLFHSVTLRLVAELKQGDGLQEVELASATFNTVDLGSQAITIAHMGPEGLESLGVTIGGIVEGGLTQIPMIAAGQTVTQGSQYLVFGGVGDGGILGSFGDDAEGLQDGEPIAEWYELTTSAPGRDPVTSRRTLFDRLTTAERSDLPTALANLKPIEVVELPDVGNVYPPLSGVISIAVSGADAEFARYLPGAIPESGIDQQASISHAMQHHLYRLGVALGEDLGLRFMPNGANVTAVHIKPMALDGTMEPVMEADILHRAIEAVGVRGESASVSPAVALASLGLIAEQLAVDPQSWIGDVAPTGFDSTVLPATAVTVQTVFASAADSGVGIVTLQSTDDLAEGLGLDSDDPALALIAADLDAGASVIIPFKRVPVNGTDRIGWWLLDADRGTIIDRMDTGGSAAIALFQDFAEYVTILRNGMTQANEVRRLGCIGAVVTMLAAFLLGAPFAGYKAGQAGMAGNYGEAVITASGGFIAGMVAFIRAPAACI